MMNRMIYCMLIGVIFLLNSALLTATISAESLSDSHEQTTSGILPGVTIYQLDIVGVKTKTVNSAIGQIVVDIETVLKAENLKSGFLNGHTDQGWVIQNVLLPENYPYDTNAMIFDLGKTGEIRALPLSLEVTADPLHRFTGGSPETYTVEDAVYMDEGDDDSFELDPHPPSPEMVEFGIQENTFNFTQPEHPNVQTAAMQCVPAAYANALQYMEAVFGVVVPHDHIMGIDGTPVNSLVGLFDVLMHRNVVSRPVGNGTSHWRALRGFLQYTHDESIPLTVRHQGLNGSADVSWTGTDTSYGQGAAVTFDFLISEIQNGHGVVMLYWRYVNGVHVGGHMVTIVTAGYILGEPFIIFSHDSLQTNYDPTDTLGLTTHQTFLNDSDVDGILNVINVGWTADGAPEMEKIVALDAGNRAPATPSPPKQGFGLITIEKDTVYNFTTSTTDPEGHDIFYIFDWGDGTQSQVGPFDSGKTATASHIWEEYGLIKIKVKARDQFYEFSDWSEEVTRAVPGFELGILLVAICLLFFVRKKRR